MIFPLKKYSKVINYYKDYIKNLDEVLNRINEKKLEQAASLIEKKIKLKKNIFLCGNGGSASIANHYVADYLKLLRSDTNLKPKFISLVSNIELITAISNDIKYEDIFSYQLETLGNKEDLIILISSSGNSKNLVKAINTAKKLKMHTISFIGFNGGTIKNKSDIFIRCS